MNELRSDIRKASGQNSLIILVLLIISVLFSVIFAVVKEIAISGGTFEGEQLISGIFQYLIIFPLSVLAVRGTKNGKSLPALKTAFGKPQASKKEIARWIIISLFMIYASTYLSNGLFTLIHNITGIELHALNLAADETALGWFTNILIMMFLAPLCEEMMFRGIMVNNSEKYGTWYSIITIGIMFGLFHMNYEQTLYASVLGICAGFLFVKTKSLIPPIILHFCMNTIGTAQSIVIGGLDLEKITNEDMQYITENISKVLPIVIIQFVIIAVMITGLVFFVLELTNHKETFILDNRNSDLSEGKKAGIYFSSPMTLFIVGILTAFTVLNAVSI